MNVRSSVSDIPRAVKYLDKELTDRKIKSKERVKMVLSAEEALNVLIKYANSEDDDISIKIVSFLGGTSIKLSCKGQKFSSAEIGEELIYDDDPEANEVIAKLNANVFSKNTEVKNSKGRNYVTIHKERKKAGQLKLMLAMLFAGIFAGIIMKGIIPQGINDAVIKYFFSPVTTMFLNALKFVAAPLVFFSIASSIAKFGDLKALGRVAARIMSGYMITSFIAIVIGLGVYNVFPIGDTGLRAAVTDAAAVTSETGEAFNVSAIDTIVGIIPTNIIEPFLKADMLKIIFVAVMTGLAVGSLGDKLEIFGKVINDGYMVFSKITTMIIAFMPLTIFCSMADMVVSMEWENLMSAFAWVPVVYVGDIMMLLFYSLVLLIAARLSPFKFFKKYHPAMFAAFSFASSNAALPSSMNICGEKLGIDKKLYSFSLPLGAAINMDGGCITQIISVLFMAKVFGIPANVSAVLSMLLAIFVLSVGSPGVPGGTLVCISILLPQIGIPAEAISIIMGLYPIVDMMQTMVNVTGDGVVTTVAAKQENMLDIEKFGS